MIFCESCRIKKKWPRSTGFPYIGVRQSTQCEVCLKIRNCHDVPGSMLVPESQKTTEQKLVNKVMQQAYREKAESLVVTYVSGAEAGQTDYTRTALMREIVIKVNGEIDWYATYQLRLKAQEGYQQAERIKRDRRNYEL